MHVDFMVSDALFYAYENNYDHFSDNLVGKFIVFFGICGI